MRVLHVLNELKPSGAETMLLSAAKEFSDAGLETHVLAIGLQPGIFSNQLADAGFVIRHLPFAKSARFFWALYKLMLDDYEVIHLHTERANFWLGVVALAATQRVVLRTIHANFEFVGHLRWRRGFQRRLLARLGVQHVSIGRSVQGNELERFGLSTRLAPNWYDSNRFGRFSPEERREARAALNIAAGESVISTVGNCSSVKNHGAVIRALSLLMPHERPIYLHVGLEESDSCERALARHLGVERWIRFLGPVADVRPAIRASDLFVMPSLREGFGIAAVEAMASALPTLLADVPGLRDFRDQTSAVFCTQPDPASIAEAIKDIFSLSSIERCRVGDRAATDVAAALGSETGVARYLELYRSGAEKAQHDAS